MADLLTAVEQVAVRNYLEKLMPELGQMIDYNKDTARTAVQAVLDRLELPATQNAISGDINSAISPATMTANQKRAALLAAVAVLIFRDTGKRIG